jgi:acetolactate synthase-1/2/3 large subunit
LITTDVGQHQMWVAQSYPFAHPRTFLTSGGLGTMGFGLPAAIGAALANPDKRVICFSGDGSIQMNLQELATLAELNLNVTVIIFNNRHLGLVRQIQQLYFNKRYSATVFECNPDFAAIAQAYGIKGITLNSPTAETLFSALEQKGPCVINAMTEPEHNVFPIVPSGQPNTLPQESENANA